MKKFLLLSLILISNQSFAGLFGGGNNTTHNQYDRDELRDSHNQTSMSSASNSPSSVFAPIIIIPAMVIDGFFANTEQLVKDTFKLNPFKK